MRSWSIAKGHGTENDFVIMVDRHGMLDPSDDDVRALCNRRTGVGGDGLLRAIRARHIPEWTGDPDLWFMDYRNADASIAEMCGNGLRVFARYLSEEGLINDSEVAIATRAGLRSVHLERDAVSVDMGAVEVEPEPTTVRLGERSYDAIAVHVGNPHAVCFVDDVSALDLRQAPAFEQSRFPEGVNVEFVQLLDDGRIAMRVFERGAGETRSCGTGTVAAAAATASGHGGRSWEVQVPGGTLHIELGETARMTGPALVTVRGEATLAE